MGNLPLVSIITGYYNRKENLENSIQSVLDQSYPNFEYIIFDDCSTDGTSDLIAAFDDSRLRVIRHEKNLGFTKGIIGAIAESKGEYIALHGAGDISFPDRIAKQVEYLQKNPQTAIVGCLLEDCSNEGTLLHSPTDGDHLHHFTQGEVMYRRSQYFQTGGYNPIFKYGQFTNLKRELLKLGDAGFVDELLYRRIHFSNGVTKNPKKSVEQKIYMAIGMELSRQESVYYLDIPKIVLRVCINSIELVKGTKQEELFLYHLKKVRMSQPLLYCFKLYKAGGLSERNFKRIANRLL